MWGKGGIVIGYGGADARAYDPVVRPPLATVLLMDQRRERRSSGARPAWRKRARSVPT